MKANLIRHVFASRSRSVLACRSVIRSQTDLISQQLLSRVSVTGQIPRFQFFKAFKSTSSQQQSNAAPFDAKLVIKDAARFELETCNQQNGAAIQQKIFTLQAKLDNESPFNAAEKSMMILMTLGDQNLRAKNNTLANQILNALISHLESYQDNNMAFYQYLLPGVLYRQALLSESIGESEEVVSKILTQVASMIEEYHQHSETLIEENIHLLAKVYEKLANSHKKNNRNSEAIAAYERALNVAQQIYPASSTFVVKTQCFLGDLLSRRVQEEPEARTKSITYLESAVQNVKIVNAQDAQIFSVAATALLRVTLDNKNTEITHEERNRVLAMVEAKWENEKLVTPLSKAVLLTLKAEYLFETQQLTQSIEVFDKALEFALATFPKEHPFVMKIFKRMKELYSLQKTTNK